MIAHAQTYLVLLKFKTELAGINFRLVSKPKSRREVAISARMYCERR